MLICYQDILMNVGFSESNLLAFKQSRPCQFLNIDTSFSLNENTSDEGWENIQSLKNIQLRSYPNYYSSVYTRNPPPYLKLINSLEKFEKFIMDLGLDRHPI